LQLGIDSQSYLPSGRILLYIRDNSPNFDLTTGKSVESVPYSTY